jgi:predicted helicase
VERARAALEHYEHTLLRALRDGNATEHTHRPALKTLLETLGDKVVATNEPKRIACGAPDYVIAHKTLHGPLTIGYVEAKDIGVSLKVAERSDQLRRYLSSLDNLILTDYLEFRWYLQGKHQLWARLADVQGHHFVKEPGGSEAVLRLLRSFLAHHAEPVSRPQQLAERMARLTHLLRDLIANAFETETASQNLLDLRAAFSEVLIPDLTVQQFADMFAQTLAYGLFAARINHTGAAPFRRQDAAREIPKTNPFLRRLFSTIAGPELDDEPFVGFVDDLAQLLADSDMEAILKDFGTRTRQQDPVVHFYETFLAAYDPLLRETRGVYYTPEPVVSYIVRSVHWLLKSRFALLKGLTDSSQVVYRPRGENDRERRAHRVLVLDPACGTGTFLYAIVDHIRDEFRRQNNAGKWAGYVHEHLLPRLFGFELLMAPYAVAHLKLGMQLAAFDLPAEERLDWSYSLESGERLQIFLTNSLQEAQKRSELLIGRYISDEANAAAEIKRELPIMVILGNPPYSGHSANKGAWITRLIRDYAKTEPGARKLAQAKWLQDDYVKFIRFGQWRIEQTGAGVLAFITNHAYLDSPTFPGMRYQLMNTFSEIYVLDLHGNARKGEKTPDGGDDENVFDIEQGVAISLFIKEPGKEGLAKVYRADVWGGREQKYDWLMDHDVENCQWTELTPDAPSYMFALEDARLKDEYERYWSVAEIMGENGAPAPGIVTTHDQFAISWSAAEAEDKVRRFLNTRSEEEARGLWKLCSQAQWNYQRAKKELADGQWKDWIKPILYRPFDQRWTVFDRNVAVHRRERVMRHMLSGQDLALITSQMTKGESFAHALVTRTISEVICISPKTSNNGFVFPLYLYPSNNDAENRMDLYGDGATEALGRQPNIAPRFVREVKDRLGLAFIPEGRGDLVTTFGPEDLLAYVYAVLYCPSYRSRYASVLRHDFPRIPLTTSLELFRRLATMGTRLVLLHLFEAPEALQPSTNYPVPGTNVVEPGHPRYLAPGARDPLSGNQLDAGRVYISSDKPKLKKRGQYFSGISPEVWSFRVGGYQVCEKWLKDRRGRVLSPADIDHYDEIVGVLAKTIELMTEIDSTIVEWPMR